MVVVVDGMPEVIGLAKDTIFPTTADESLSPFCTGLIVVVTSLLATETGFFPPSVCSVVLTPEEVVSDNVFGFGSVLVVVASSLAVRNCLTLSAAASLSLSKSSLVAVDPEERGAGCISVCVCVCVCVCV